MKKDEAVKEARIGVLMQGGTWYVTRKRDSYSYVHVDSYDSGRHGTIAEIFDAARVRRTTPPEPTKTGPIQQYIVTLELDTTEANPEDLRGTVASDAGKITIQRALNRAMDNGLDSLGENVYLDDFTVEVHNLTKKEEPLFREHLPMCGFLRSGKEQTACNCAQLLTEVAKPVYSVMKNDPTVICIDNYVAFDIRVALSHSKYATKDAEEFAARIVELLNSAKTQDLDVTKERRIAILDSREESRWLIIFSHQKALGHPDDIADENTFRQMQAEFPRLQAFDGISDATHA